MTTDNGKLTTDNYALPDVTAWAGCTKRRAGAGFAPTSWSRRPRRSRALGHHPFQPVRLGEDQGTQPERQQHTMPERTAQDFTFLAD